MIRPVRRCLFACALLTAPSCLSPAAPAATGPLDFQKHVRPILSQHCFKCHGPDENKREAGLRLDLRESALAPAKSGTTPIAPKDPGASELVRRIFSADPDTVMPPPSTKNPLTEPQRAALKQWVSEGAEYRPHWAYIPPKKAGPPEAQLKDWPRNAIDRFVLARLQTEGLRPSPEADRHTLLRRVYLDLIGLPPTPDEADAFFADQAPDAYERAVDRLLASPHYGERWARRWMDLARYADTNGYEKDRPRTMWPWRDWVIRAINDDMPFDQFTIEQVAGDLLPDPTLEQRIATGFHRNAMLNEEGGIDPLEFRYHAMADRVAVTGKTWLGLTLNCAQCHTHKFDPITHREYFQVMANLDNADEPEIEVPQPDVAEKRAAWEKEVAEFLAKLPDRFPVPDVRWLDTGAASLDTAASKVSRPPDGSFRVSGEIPDKDTYTLTFPLSDASLDRLRLETLRDDDLPGKGPGHSGGGNFVLSEIRAALVGPKGTTNWLKFARAEADFSQPNFAVAHAIDGKPTTGWAIAQPKVGVAPRTATFHLNQPEKIEANATLLVQLIQDHGQKHVLGRFRLRPGQPITDPRPIGVRRKELVDEAIRSWLGRESARTVAWSILKPREAKSPVPILQILEDYSIFVHGDKTKSDTYEIRLVGDLQGATAIRLDAMIDDRLPLRGPGRTDYEGPKAEFFLSEFGARAGDAPLKFSCVSVSHSRKGGGVGAIESIDGDPQTGWSAADRPGVPQHAIFHLARPIPTNSELTVTMLFEKHYAAGLGRFRISVTRDPRVVEARDIPPDAENALRVPDAERTAAQRDLLARQALLAAPAMAPVRAEYDKLLAREPRHPTVMVMQERPAGHTRPTFIRHRGEYLQPKEQVQPGIPSILPPLPPDAPKNRLGFARWLVSRDNPLTARVTMNRHWAAFFGRGLVRTTDDFGYQGEWPTHPELLDWLAIEFMDRAWSIKSMHRLIVTSATYRQSSHLTPELLARDPSNQWLARGPRIRLEAEQIRDYALTVSGQLSRKIGGPSVFPPQDPAITKEGTYGPLEWNISEGPDRYRRGMYTFAKRTAPYAMFATFDAPSGEACITLREISNTPLQALTLLNNEVLVDASRHVGRTMATRTGSIAERMEYLLRRQLVRPPRPGEIALLIAFFDEQLARLARKEIDASQIAGPGDGDPDQRAAWTLVARALFNLDESITKS